MRFPWQSAPCSPDPYTLLSVTPQASPEEILQAYLRQRQQVRPEAYHSRYKQYASQYVRRLDDAYHVLSDPSLRRRLDRQRSKVNPRSSDASQLKGLAMIRIISVAFGVYLVLTGLGALLRSGQVHLSVVALGLLVVLYGAMRFFRKWYLKH